MQEVTGSIPVVSTRKILVFDEDFSVIFAYGELYCFAVIFGLRRVILASPVNELFDKFRYMVIIMTGISIAARREWEYTIKYFNVQSDELSIYPFGKYFFKVINGKDVIFYCTGVRKVNSAAANQYMIMKFDLEKVIVAGTCAGIDSNCKVLDVIIPNVAYQYDCTVKEIEPLIKEKYTVELDLSGLSFEFKTGSIGTADKAVVMWEDFLELKNNNITIGDTESAAVAQVCTMNNVKCVIIKGISDFPKDNNCNDEQHNEFVDNVPKVMKTIFDDYLRLII